MSLQALAYDSDYTKPWKFKLEIRSADTKQLIHTWDAFSNNNEIALQAIRVNDAIGQTGDFEFIIDDSHDRVIDPSITQPGNQVTIQVGQDASSYENIAYGYTMTRHIKRRGGSGLRYTFTGQGSAVILQNTLVNIVSLAPPKDIEEGKVVDVDTTDEKFLARNIFRRIFTDPLVALYKGAGNTIQQRGNFDLSGISEDITEIVPAFVYEHVPATQPLNALSEMVGAIWRVDAYNRIIFEYPTASQSGILLKETWEEGDTANVSYIETPDGWGVLDSIKPEDGFLPRIFGIVEQTSIVSAENRALAFESLWNKDIATRVIPGPAKFTHTTLILSKTGAGTDADNPAIAEVFGAIVADDGQNQPAGDLIATFRIPLEDIKPDPAPISRLNIQFQAEVDIAKPHWILLFERGDSEENTVRWWHDNDRETSTDLELSPPRDRYSSIRPLPFGRSDGDPLSGIDWATSSHGPVYTHAFSTKSKILVEATHPQAVRRWVKGHPWESVISAPWVRNVHTMQLYLPVLLETTARMPRIFEVGQVTIPNIPFKAGEHIQITDSLLTEMFPFNNNVLAQIQEVHWAADAYSETALGTNKVELVVKGWVRPFEA